jgi:hypothetical protein
VSWISPRDTPGEARSRDRETIFKRLRNRFLDSPTRSSTILIQIVSNCLTELGTNSVHNTRVFLAVQGGPSL